MNELFIDIKQKPKRQLVSSAPEEINLTIPAQTVSLKVLSQWECFKYFLLDDCAFLWHVESVLKIFEMGQTIGWGIDSRWKSLKTELDDGATALSEQELDSWKIDYMDGLIQQLSQFLEQYKQIREREKLAQEYQIHNLGFFIKKLAEFRNEGKKEQADEFERRIPLICLRIEKFYEQIAENKEFFCEVLTSFAKQADALLNPVPVDPVYLQELQGVYKQVSFLSSPTVLVTSQSEEKKIVH